MKISSTDKELIKHLLQLNTAQKKRVMELLKSFLPESQTSNKALAKYNKELDEAMERIDNRNCTTLEELEKEMNGW